MNLASPEAAITDWLATQKQAMLDLLERLVNTDSGSYDKPGVDAVGAQIKAFFDSHGIAVETIPGATKGDVLRAVLPAPDQAGGNAGRNIVLLYRAWF